MKGRKSETESKKGGGEKVKKGVREGESERRGGGEEAKIAAPARAPWGVGGV